MNSETSESLFKKLRSIGADKNEKNEKNAPTGGFPPIVECLEVDHKTRREFATKTTLVNISTILAQKRKTVS